MHLSIFLQWSPSFVLVLISAGILWAIIDYIKGQKKRKKHGGFIITVASMIFIFILFMVSTKFYFLSGVFAPYPL